MAENARPGDSGRITRDYFDSLLPEMRLIDSDLPDTKMTLYGHDFSTPVMVAALSRLEKVHPNGLTEMAIGAKAASAVMWAGTGDDAELESIVATGAKTIKIIKPYVDNNEILRKIKHAEGCGVIAVGMDIDHAFSRKGGYDSIRGMDMRPKTLDDIKSFVSATTLPFIIKGILSVQDAEKCLDAGVARIVVSHHHGIMDYALPPLMILPKIVEAVHGRMQIFVDCNVERGMDVFKAMALGATAVSVGRALMGPMGEGGADKVCETINTMTGELSFAMSMTGSPNISNIDPSLVWKKH